MLDTAAATVVYFNEVLTSHHLVQLLKIEKYRSPLMKKKRTMTNQINYELKDTSSSSVTETT